MRKLKKRVSITLEKEKFEKQISALEKSNDSLRRLRQQVCELQQPPAGSSRSRSGCLGTGQLPVDFSKFGAIRRASKSLHEALSTSWSSTSKPQLSHSVCLFLTADAPGEVQMEVAISCDEARISQTTIVQSGLMPLEVRSKTLDSEVWENDADTGLLTPESGNSQRGRGPRKRRKVRFAGPHDSDEDDPEQCKLAESASSATVQMHTNGRLSGHFCSELKRQVSDPSLYDVGICLGHIEATKCVGEPFRHWLYPNRKLLNLCGDSVVRMEEVIGQPVHARLTIVGQLRLALQLASAVLKFSSTPWLNDLWTIRDVVVGDPPWGHLIGPCGPAQHCAISIILFFTGLQSYSYLLPLFHSIRSNNTFLARLPLQT
jgi:hypothetical protein